MKITMRVPKAAISSQRGQLSKWYVEDGAGVKAGQLLYCIEMEKTALDIEAPFDGVVKHLAEVGKEYAVGDAIAELTRA